ncbi:MAG: hypothetical protein ABIV63_03160, partial [Caldimonas sp.]
MEAPCLEANHPIHETSDTTADLPRPRPGAYRQPGERPLGIAAMVGALDLACAAMAEVGSRTTAAPGIASTRRHVATDPH